MDPNILTYEVGDFTVTHDVDLGLLSVEHDGTITWDQLQELKNIYFGSEARAIEVYPAQSHVVNSKQCRHLWRLGDHEFCPDLLGPVCHDDTLQGRYVHTWARGTRL